jgi:hypothetical protein
MLQDEEFLNICRQKWDVVVACYIAPSKGVNKCQVKDSGRSFIPFDHQDQLCSEHFLIKNSCSSSLVLWEWAVIKHDVLHWCGWFWFNNLAKKLWHFDLVSDFV